MRKVKKMIFISLLVSIGLALGVLESMIPLPFMAPGAKLGLSNIVILVTLTVLGFREALFVGGLKSILLALVTGNVSSLFYSLSGAVVSCVLMYLVYKYLSNIFSLIGVSIFGAMGHNFAQVLVASFMLNNFRIFYYYPILLLTSLFTGYFVGLSSNYIKEHLEQNLEDILDIR